MARGFDTDGAGEDTIFVVGRRTGVRAFRNLCPHMGARLEYRQDRFLSADGERVTIQEHDEPLNGRVRVSCRQ